MKKRFIAPWILFLVVWCGCGDDQVGIPEPVPIPGPLSDLCRATSAPLTGEGAVDVVGLPGSVPYAGLITAENRGETFKTLSKVNGSFLLGIHGQTQDVVRLSFEGSTSATRLTIRGPQASYALPPKPIPGVPPVSSPQDGAVTVRGQASPNASILGLNFSRGEITLTTCLSDGTFALTLSGQSQERLRIFEDATPLENPWELTIP